MEDEELRSRRQAFPPNWEQQRAALIGKKAAVPSRSYPRGTERQLTRVLPEKTYLRWSQYLLGYS